MDRRTDVLGIDSESDGGESSELVVLRKVDDTFGGKHLPPCLTCKVLSCDFKCFEDVVELIVEQMGLLLQDVKGDAGGWKEVYWEIRLMQGFGKAEDLPEVILL